MSKKESTASTASTTVDPSIRAILDSMQKQQEEYRTSTAELQRQILFLAQQTDEENKRRTREIETIGRTLAGLQLGTSSKIAASDFGSLLTSDLSEESRHTTIPRPKPDPSGTPLPRTLPAEEEALYEEEYTQVRTITPTLPAREAICYIPVLNGDDDVGVEDFIKEVRELRNMCVEKELLLKAIKVEKITGKAAQGIRNIPISSFGELYEALRLNVATQVTADEYSEQLRETKQRKEESVQNYNIRFRRILNKLTYAITNEYPQPLTRKIMMEATMKKVNRIYLKGLQRDIGRIILANEPSTLADAEKKAADIERYLREEQSEWKKTAPSYHEIRPFPRRSDAPRTLTQRPNTIATPPPNQRMTLPRPQNYIPTRSFNRLEQLPLQERKEIRCYKCNRLGHTANQCGQQNFQSNSQRNLPPPKVHQIPVEEEEEEQYESTQQLEDYLPLDSTPQEEEQISYSTQEPE